MASESTLSRLIGRVRSVRFEDIVQVFRDPQDAEKNNESESDDRLVLRVQKDFTHNISLSNSSTPMIHVPTSPASVAFVFDIDGVLIKGKNPVPGASETLAYLQKWKIPFIFLTNGGGKTEKDHAALVSTRLELNFSEEQFVQSHTPFRDLVPEFMDKTILVLGGQKDHIREVATDYGFNKIVTSWDVYKTFPNVYPFSELSEGHHTEHGRPLPLDKNGRLSFAAILVFSSPRDWGMDQQLVVDLLLSEKGIFGTESLLNGNKNLPNDGFLQDGQPTIYYCNPDLVWATTFHQPRHAQGAFAAGLQGIWSARTRGADIRSNVKNVGKPTTETFVYGEKTLHTWHTKIHRSTYAPDIPVPEIKTIFMVGDNPASDIQGANDFTSRFAATWKSILVESGVYVAGTEPSFTPTGAIVQDIKAAVQWGLDSVEWVEPLARGPALSRPGLAARQKTEYRLSKNMLVAPAELKLERRATIA